MPKLAGLRVDEFTVERSTARTGADIGTRLEKGQTFETSKAWVWSNDADQTVAYVSADATGEEMQGPNGSAA